MMAVAMAADLVAPSHQLPHQLRVRAGGHAQHEERGADTQLVEQVEQDSCLTLQRRPRPLPAGRPHAAVDQLVPVLEVDTDQERLAGVWEGHRIVARVPQEASPRFANLVDTRERRWSVCLTVLAGPWRCPAARSEADPA